MIKTFVLTRQEPTQPFTGEEGVNAWLTKNPGYVVVGVAHPSIWQLALVFQLQEPPVITSEFNENV